MSIAKHLFDIGNGIRSGVSDVPSLVTNILELDVHGVATDTRKVIGDAGDVLNGVAGLGVELGSAPIKYAGSLGKWADSPVLSAAQLFIEGQKKLTGTGDIEAGGGFAGSATNLETAVTTLIGAELEDNDDGWNGAAARTYNSTSKAHRQHVSNVSVADKSIGKTLEKEAQQVRETRECLDSTSQLLYDYGLATRAILAIPGANVAKILSADVAAAGAAMTTTSAQMGVMVYNSIQNARDIRTANDLYEAAKKDSSGNAGGCGPFVDPRVDQNDLPARARAATKYEPRQVDPTYGPPATPLPVESELPPTYDLPADIPLPHITPPNRLPSGLPK
ncbi:EspA/EspE family type VII secretion system effector [Mycobacterium sp. GA-1841]|uniref:EspA/EspE family type VII secretion system effector n=1 Tax=Mycobacterium sp. GA-1841 TaxID=1834154 RepID=UPI00111564AC|nr:EspA/EspE family type VII secretion system effector [Mycobacterium sp. GA-1841]